MSVLEDVRLLRSFIREHRDFVLKQPEGRLRHKFLEPGAIYKAVLWDWDSFFTACSLIPDGYPVGEYLQGCVRNFVSAIEEDGYIPFRIAAEGPESARDALHNACKPLLAQMAAIASNRSGDFDWLQGSVFRSLQSYIRYWETRQLTRFGLFAWRSHRGSGADNHPAVYGRPLDSSAGADLNALFVREYEAMSYIASRLGLPESAEPYRNKAQSLIDSMNRYLWDPVDGLYYHADVASETVPNTTQVVDWTVPLKYRAWTCFMPLWAGAAPREAAERTIREHLLDERQFWSPFGIRSLSAAEPLYRLSASKNPSNWQGPVWTISNYLTFRGLMNYGFEREARQLAANTLTLLAEDVRRNGTMHEYYHPETGEGIINPGFMNWNLLAVTMWDELEQGRDYTDFRS